MIEVINGFLAGFDPKLVLGASALIGSLIHAGYSVYRKKKADKKFKFDLKKILDTVWQSTVGGVLAASAIGATLEGVAFAMLAGVGIDTVTNKTVILNLFQVVSKYLQKKK